VASVGAAFVRQYKRHPRPRSECAISGHHHAEDARRDPAPAMQMSAAAPSNSLSSNMSSRGKGYLKGINDLGNHRAEDPAMARRCCCAEHRAGRTRSG